MRHRRVYHLRIGQIRRNLGKKLVIPVMRHRFSPPSARSRPWRLDMPHSIVMAKGISVTFYIHAHHKTPRFAHTRTFFGKEQAVRPQHIHLANAYHPKKRRGPNGTFASNRSRTDRGVLLRSGIRSFLVREQNPLAQHLSRRASPHRMVEQERHGYSSESRAPCGS